MQIPSLDAPTSPKHKSLLEYHPKSMELILKYSDPQFKHVTSFKHNRKQAATMIYRVISKPIKCKSITVYSHSTKAL